MVWRHMCRNCTGVVVLGGVDVVGGSLPFVAGVVVQMLKACCPFLPCR